MKTVTIPEVEITLDQLVTAVRQLEPAARSQLAKALVETELDARMAELIESLANRPAADDVTDADVHLVDEILIVKRRPTDFNSADLHRLHDRDRCQRSGSSDLRFDVHNLCDLLSGCKFISDSPAWTA